MYIKFLVCVSLLSSYVSARATETSFSSAGSTEQSFYISQLKKKNSYRAKADIARGLMGSVKVSFDYKLAPQISMGHEVFFDRSLLNSADQAWGLGLNVDFALWHEALTSGFTIRPQINYTNFYNLSQAELAQYNNLAKNSFGVGTLLIYEFFFDNGINLSLGAGTKINTSHRYSPFQFDFDMSVGFAF